MTKQRRELHLDNKVVEALQIQAIKSGHKTFKRYAEHILRVQAAREEPLRLDLEVTNA